MDADGWTPIHRKLTTALLARSHLKPLHEDRPALREHVALLVGPVDGQPRLLQPRALADAHALLILIVGNLPPVVVVLEGSCP